MHQCAPHVSIIFCLFIPAPPFFFFSFAALGLQEARVSTTLDAAVGLRASAELLLTTVQRVKPELSCFLSWLMRLYRKMKHEAPPTSEEMPPLDNKAVAAFQLNHPDRFQDLYCVRALYPRVTERTAARPCM